MSVSELYIVVLGGGVVLLVGSAATWKAGRLGLLILLLVPAAGVAVGKHALDLPAIDADLAHILGMAALAAILVQRGLTTSWSDVKRLALPAGLLASAGVVVSVTVTAIGAHLVLGMHWKLGILLGAVVSCTDAAAVPAVLRSLPLPRRITALLDVESGFNAAPAIALVLAFSTAGTGLPAAAGALSPIGYQLIAGGAIGLAVGRIGVALLRHVRLPAAGMHPVAGVGLGVVAFAAAGVASASAVIAAFLAGLMVGNSRLPYRAATRSCAEGAGCLAQIGLIALLGLLVTPADLLDAIAPALAVATVLLLVGRPLSVVASLLPLSTPWRDQALIAWAGLPGTMPIALITIPLAAGVPGSAELVSIVVVLVVILSLAQGLALTVVARRLRNAGAAPEVDAATTPLDLFDADLLTIDVAHGSRLAGITIVELRLSPPTVVALINRDDTTFVPDHYTMLRTGDRLLLVTSDDKRDCAERRLRAIGRRGRLASWHGEYGDPHQPAPVAPPTNASPAVPAPRTQRRL